jgi:DNA-binding response OmpR family regulator
MKRFRVLVVDDEPGILQFINVKLKVSGYEVLIANNGFEALEQFQAQDPDLLILDITMPKMDGFETIKQLRAFSAVPVIILSAREATNDKIKGLQLGADDYLAKPFSPDELLARIEAIKRRQAPARDRKVVNSITLEHMTIDLKKHFVIVNGKEIQLARTEWLLLSELARNAGKLMLYGELLTKVWGPEYRDDIRVLRNWVCRLRKKIEHDPGHPVIRTVPKTGYMIAQPIA